MAMTILGAGWITGIALGQAARPPQKLPHSQEKSLRQSIDAYWSAWKNRDYEGAEKLVIKDQRGRFRRVRKFPVRKWTVEKIEPAGSLREARVVVIVERLEPIMGDYFNWRQVGTWVQVKSQWFFRLPESLP